MSLIQQALEKTNRAQETRTTTPVPASKPWDRDPMGAKLEQDLIRIQQEHVRKRGLYWKIALAVLIICFAAGLFFVSGIREEAEPLIEVSPMAVVAPVPVPAASRSPLKIDAGDIFRLTGIMDLGDRPMAVINGNIVGVGDSLSDKANVKAIGEGEVLLDIEGQEIRLKL